MAFCPEHPKWDQNPKFTPLSETTSIPTTFICGVLPQDHNLYLKPDITKTLLKQQQSSLQVVPWIFLISDFDCKGNKLRWLKHFKKIWLKNFKWQFSFISQCIAFADLTVNCKTKLKYLQMYPSLLQFFFRNVINVPNWFLRPRLK